MPGAAQILRRARFPLPNRTVYFGFKRCPAFAAVAQLLAWRALSLAPFASRPAGTALLTLIFLRITR